MKNVVHTAGLLLACLVLSTAAVDIKTGFKAGASLSKFTGADAQTLDDSATAISGLVGHAIDDYPQRLGMAGAVTFCAQFNDWVALMSELSFAKKGNIWKGSVDIAKIVNAQTDTVTSPLTIERKMNYFELPVMAACKPRFGRWSPFLYAGPVISFNCFAETVVKVDGDNYKESDIKFLIFGQTKSDMVVFEAGYRAGGGVGYTLGRYEITLEARASNGITSIFKDTKISTSTIEMLLGVLILR
ncbi:MAG: PorT family protein [Chitinispirillaceae bacterium]|nr:PorT family protein [Chitinispirillaceae bacterium]